MSISVQCTSCAGRFAAPDIAIGKVATCPKCGNQITIEPPAQFETAPIIQVSQADIDRATRRQKPRPNVAVVGISLAALLAAIVVGYLVFKSQPYSESAAGADIAPPQEILDAKAASQSAGLGFSLEEFKLSMPTGKYWKLLSETTRDNGTVSYQLLSTDMKNVLLITSGNPDNLGEVSLCFSAVKAQAETDTITRILLMATIFAKYSDWTEEEIGEWWGRLIQRGAKGEEEFHVQKNGQELFMTPIGVQGGTMFITGVIADPESKAPTLEEWLATHPKAPPKSGKSHFHSAETAGKVANASFSFKNFRHKGRGDFIGELVNESGRSYQGANFKLSVYDASGALIDTGSIVVMNFKPKESRSFDAHIEGVPGYFSYKMDFESGF